MLFKVTVQDAFWPIPDRMSWAEVIGRWYFMHQMYSGGWPYSCSIDRSSYNVATLCVAVLQRLLQLRTMSHE